MHPECRIYFDTFEELFSIMKKLDFEAINKVSHSLESLHQRLTAFAQVRMSCAKTIVRHRNEVLRLWGNILGVATKTYRSRYPVSTNRTEGLSELMHKRPHSALAHLNGSVVMCKKIHKQAVYLIENGTKRMFQSATAFLNMGKSFDDVRHISVEEFEDIPLGDPIF